MNNKRKHERFMVSAYIGVFDFKTDQLLGGLVDMSNDGLQIVGEEPCKEGLTHKLRVEMHKEICGTKSLLLHANSVWCTKRNVGNLYVTGFQLLNIDEDTSKRINLLMQSSAFRNYKLALASED